jgi:hypothetical protein
MKVPMTINDLLDGHVILDLECLDRIYLNGYAAGLQDRGQVVWFLTRHLGNPIRASGAVREDRDPVPRRCASLRGGAVPTRTSRCSRFLTTLPSAA